MALQALNFIRYRKPTQLLTPWKISPYSMTCVTKTINGGWRLEFKLTWSRRQQPPPRDNKTMYLQKLRNSLQFGKACGIDGIPNGWSRHLPRRLLVHLTRLFNHCFRLSHFPKPWRQIKVVTLPKPGKDPEFPPYIWPISFFSTTGKLFEKIILKIVKKNTEEKACLTQASLLSVYVTVRHCNVWGLRNMSH
jgi:hypothetical protein